MEIASVKRCLSTQATFSCVPEGCRRSAVLVLLQEADHGWQFILIKRAQSLPLHGGEIAFAGGQSEPADNTPIDTALREVNEELGIPAERITVLGVLPYVMTLASGFAIIPVVGILDSDFSRFKLEVREVERVLTVPLHHFSGTPVGLGPEQYFLKGFYFKEQVIWGATLRVIQEFLKCVKSS